MNAWMFFGYNGWRGYSLDSDGADLPDDKGPWTVFKNIVIPPDSPPYDDLAVGNSYVELSKDSQGA